MTNVRGLIFDLDGVLTDTAELHYQAWKQLADNYKLKFDYQMNELLKGISRNESLNIILDKNNASSNFSESLKKSMAQEKNEIYVNLIETITPEDILPGVIEFLNDAKNRGYKLAVASASRNAGTVLDRLKIEKLFDYVANAAEITNNKPDPEIFQNCAEQLGLYPAECIGFEDAGAGIEAIKRAKMFAVGINVSSTTCRPDLLLNNTAELNLDNILKEVS